MPRKILVIDDDLFWHRLLKRLFGGTDYDIYAAAGCEDGVRMAERHKPDCILLDFLLKDGDAVDVCAALKNGAERPRFPVIVVSSDPGAEITAYAECKADYFVLKGSHAMMELPKIVSEVLGYGGRTVFLGSREIEDCGGRLFPTYPNPTPGKAVRPCFTAGKTDERRSAS